MIVHTLQQESASVTLNEEKRKVRRKTVKYRDKIDAVGNYKTKIGTKMERQSCSHKLQTASKTLARARL